jgi:hypothetical protein
MPNPSKEVSVSVASIESAVDVRTRLGVHELEFIAAREPEDPWAAIRLDVEFVDPDGAARVVPAFWAGGRSWRARYSSRIPGIHGYRTIVRADEETGLDGHSGEVTITGAPSGNRLLLHGAPTVAPDGRHLMHEDGTPFLWLADTWWSALTERFRWPDTFQTLTADRAGKGFTVIQLVAGLVPEFGLFSPQMASEGGQPWHDHGNGPINPAFFDVPDLKIDHLVANGLVPCVVGGWGSWARVLDREKVLQHWRYVVARYAAYPVVWCLAGEVEVPIPFAPLDGRSSHPDELLALIEAGPAEWLERGRPQVDLWEEASRLVAEIDPFDRIRTVHPCPGLAWSSSGAFSSRDTFDLDMLQTGHSGLACVPDTMEHLHASLAHGDKPVINGECSYEGIGGSCWEDVQRFLFWSHVLSGAAGHTYGTMPISTFSSRDDHYVPPSRASSADWEDAIEWRGAVHVGVGRRILERLRWWELRPAPEAIEPHAGPEDWFRPYAARHPDGSVVAYLPGLGQSVPKPDHTLSALRERKALVGLTPGARYRATYVNPRTGIAEPSVAFEAEDGRCVLAALGRALADMAGTPTMFPRDAPTWEDWVLIVRPESSAVSVSQRPWQ